MTNSQPQQPLPPELQQRINDIVAQAQVQGQATVAGMTQQQAPATQQTETTVPARPPSLMDHVIALRQEVHALRQQQEAMAQVTQAVGNAVGELYQMFQVQAEPTNYSTNFQTQRPSSVDVDY